MDASSSKKSVQEWLLELNDPQMEHRRDTLNALGGSGTLDDGLVNELKLIARGDPDLKIQLLAKKILKSHGINILPQISYQPGVKQPRLLLSSEFWVGFFLSPILNCSSFYLIVFFTPVATRYTLTLQLAVNVILLIFFWRTRKNIALGMLAAFGLFVVILIWLIFSLRCFPDGCANP